MLKRFVRKKLEKSVRRYFAKHTDVRLIVVSGNTGTLTTATNIATVLASRMRVRMHDERIASYDELLLALLGLKSPRNLYGIGGYIQLSRAIRQRVAQPNDTDAIVQALPALETGTVARLGRLARPSIAVVTGVDESILQGFESSESLGREIVEIVNISEQAFIDRDDMRGGYAQYITNPNITTYGITGAAEYSVEIKEFTVEDGYTCQYLAPGVQQEAIFHIPVIGEHSLRAALVAIAVGARLGMSAQELIAAARTLHSAPGCMHVLRGMNDSHIIDDTMSVGMAAARAALTALYSVNAAERIAVIGDMGVSGTVSDQEYQALGEFCDSSLLAWVVTVGPASEAHVAPLAKRQGCNVKSFRSPLEAGAFVHSVLANESAVLVEGLSEVTYLEEAIKVILHATHEDHELIRQDEQSMKKKHTFFENL